EINNQLLKLSGAGELSIKKAAALLAEKKPRGATAKPKPKTDENVGREWLKVLAADELVAVLRELHGPDYLREVMAAAAKVLDAAGATNRIDAPSPSTATAGLRRM